MIAPKLTRWELWTAVRNFKIPKTLTKSPQTIVQSPLHVASPHSPPFYTLTTRGFHLVEILAVHGLGLIATAGIHSSRPESLDSRYGRQLLTTVCHLRHS